MLSAEECLAKSRELEDCAAESGVRGYREMAEYWRVLAAMAAWQERFVRSNGPVRLN